jgi:4,5:9,10-diseco-3-hydroxy-5,9,17-trioxoandrosta-1(10),2-diene-4-oate hydrolase
VDKRDGPLERLQREARMTISREQATGRYLVAEGVRIHYGDVGSGSPVLLLHGAGPGADAWGNFRANIDDLSASHRLLLPDLPRFGRSDKVGTERPRLDFLAGVLGAFLDELDIDRLDIVGNSLGGQSGMKLAIDQPGRIRRVVVVGSNAISRTAFSPLPAEAVRRIASYYQGDGPSPERMRGLIEALVFDGARVTDELVAERFEASIDPEVVALNRSGHWPRQSLDAELGRLAAPTLLVWGQDDRASPIESALMMLRVIPDARLHVFNRCGHWAQIERATEFNRLVLDFLGD